MVQIQQLAACGSLIICFCKGGTDGVVRAPDKQHIVLTDSLQILERWLQTKFGGLHQPYIVRGAMALQSSPQKCRVHGWWGLDQGWIVYEI